MKKQVTKSAIIKRINRKLDSVDEQLFVRKSNDKDIESGKYYIVSKIGIIEQFDDLKSKAIELKVIKEFEEIAG